jgi:hypothetical protein
MKKTFLVMVLAAVVFAVLIGSCAFFDRGALGMESAYPSGTRTGVNPGTTNTGMQETVVKVEQVTFGDDDFRIQQKGDNTICITGYHDSKKFDNTLVVIPERIYGLPVTEIGKDAFSSSYNSSRKIIGVTIPDTVTTIGTNAFNYSGLRMVGMGKSVKVISEGAFKNNPDLRAIIFPDSVTEIGDSAFLECGLFEVTLPAGLTRISARAFANNEQMRYVSIPDSVTSIGFGAFVSNNLTSVTLPTGLTEIDARAFEGNRLTSVILPAGLTKIGVSAFKGNRLTSVTIPASIKNVGRDTVDMYTDRNGVFANNPITSITLPAKMDNELLRLGCGFEENFTAFYYGQNEAAGTYIKNGPIWARSTAGGID